MNSIIEFQVNSNDIRRTFLLKVQRKECIQKNGTKQSSIVYKLARNSRKYKDSLRVSRYSFNSDRSRNIEV